MQYFHITYTIHKWYTIILVLQIVEIAAKASISHLRAPDVKFHELFTLRYNVIWLYIWDYMIASSQHMVLYPYKLLYIIPSRPE